MANKKIIEPDVNVGESDYFKDPPLCPHGDVPIDKNGRVVQQDVAKDFNECLDDYEC